MTETWRNIEGYEGLYEVSTFGRVKSLYHNRERILQPRYVRGYYTVALYKDGVQKNYLVHRLVADAFIPNPYALKQVNHLNGNKLDNIILNLCWCTASENQTHAFATGLNNPGKGETSRNHKLTDEIVNEIRKSYIPRDKVYGCRALAEKYGVTHQHISDLVRHKKWK